MYHQCITTYSSLSLAIRIKLNKTGNVDTEIYSNTQVKPIAIQQKDYHLLSNILYNIELF